MDFRLKYRSAFKILSARLLNKKSLLAVTWYLTYQCNYTCQYCGIPDLYSGDELNTAEVLRVIDQLKAMGIIIISFGGGEPLLRDDIGKIINYCRSININVNIISNGALVPERVEALKNLNVLRLSFDGPEFIHDQLRGAGAYQKVMQALSIAKKRKIKVAFNVTLNKLNLPYIEFIINKSKELRIPVRFSPLKYIHSGNKNIEGLMPSPRLYKQKIDFLIQEAIKNRYVANSLPALRYLRFYPEGRRLGDCAAGKVFCHIKPNGDIHPCEARKFEGRLNCLKDGVKKAFSVLPLYSCSQCWCAGTLELNMVYLFKTLSLIKVITNDI